MAQSKNMFILQQLLSDIFQNQKNSVGPIFSLNLLTLIDLVVLENHVNLIKPIDPINPNFLFSIFKSKLLVRLD